MLSEKGSLSRMGILAGKVEKSWEESFKWGDLVQTVHFIDDETVAPRS